MIGGYCDEGSDKSEDDDRTHYELRFRLKAGGSSFLLLDGQVFEVWVLLLNYEEIEGDQGRVEVSVLFICKD